MRRLAFGKLNIRKRVEALGLAALVAFSVAGSSMGQTNAAEAQTDAVEAAAEEPLPVETISGDDTLSTDLNVAAEEHIMAGEYDTVTVWEWKKVKRSNISKLGKSSMLSMFVPVDYQGHSRGIVSAYGDTDHVFRYPGATETYDSNWKELPYNTVWSVSILSGGGNGRYELNKGTKEQSTHYIKMDTESQSIDKSYFKKDAFYTFGGVKGALYFDGRTTNSGAVGTLQLADPSYRNDPSVNIDTFKKNILNLYSLDNFRSDDDDENETWMKVHNNRQAGVHTISIEDPKQYGNWVDKDTSYYAGQHYGENQWNDYDGVDYRDELWCFKTYNYKSWSYGFLDLGTAYLSAMYLCTRGQYMFPTRETYCAGGSASAYNPISDFCWRYMWYTGIPHRFATFKGLADKETGNRVVTISKGQFKEVGGQVTYGASGDKIDIEGTILLEGTTLVIDGGTVSVSGNFINNGKIIIKNGGTLVVKDGGTISPFFDTDEGFIECQGGNVVIMPKGRAYCLSSEKNMNLDSGTPSLLLTGGSSVINYGSLATSWVQMAQGCKIENRKNGVYYAGHNRINKDVMMHLSSNFDANLTGIIPKEETAPKSKSGSADISLKTTDIPVSSFVRPIAGISIGKWKEYGEQVVADFTVEYQDDSYEYSTFDGTFKMFTEDDGSYVAYVQADLPFSPNYLETSRTGVNVNYTKEELARKILYACFGESIDIIPTQKKNGYSDPTAYVEKVTTTTKASYGVNALKEGKATVINEKTAKLISTYSGYEYLPKDRVDVITPEY